MEKYEDEGSSPGEQDEQLEKAEDEFTQQHQL